MIQISPPWFVDEFGRILLLHGVNLGGSSKVPTRPDGATYKTEGFFDHQNVSFIGRPFPLVEADEHLSRLKAWGFNTLRLLVTWEAIEHAGPGIYDEEYLDYLQAVVEKAGQYGFCVFIDPHEDVWSRFSGGDGAPGWTFEAAGMDMRKFEETGAAIVHQTHGDPFPRMIWPTNNNKFAAATMFTLFFGGNDFASKTLVDGMPIQDFLQDHYIGAMLKVAERLKSLSNVIGYEVMNEPSRGYIGLKGLDSHFGELQLGISPTPFKSIVLAGGIPQKIEVLDRTYFGVRKIGEQWVNPKGVPIWLPGHKDIWIENGVWGLDEKQQPVLRNPMAFAEVNGRLVDFQQDYYLPFILKYTDAIRQVVPEAIIFIGSVPTETPPTLDDGNLPNMAYADHWYDGLSLLFKRYSPVLGYDNIRDRVVIGKRAIQAAFNRALLHPKLMAKSKLKDAPVLIGEIGIPFDMSQKKAYKSGDFGEQIKTFDRTFQALDANLLSYTLWNYTSDNNNLHGDLWNDEDLSIFSRDQQTDPSDINSGGRALEAVIRPYPLATAGTPIFMHFDVKTRNFEYQFEARPEIKAPTVLYVPRYHYPEGPDVECSFGRIELDLENQLIRHFADRPGLCVIRMRKRL